MIALLTFAALTGQTVPVLDERLSLTRSQATNVEVLAERLCPKAFKYGRPLVEWLEPVMKRKRLTDIEQLLLISNCVLYSQGRTDEQGLGLRRHRRR